METINQEHNLNLDSCLIARYRTDELALSLHQDNESILDSLHPIALTSFGTPRTIQFWDSRSEVDGHLVNEVQLNQGDVLIMKSGCQDKC